MWNVGHTTQHGRKHKGYFIDSPQRVKQSYKDAVDKKKNAH